MVIYILETGRMIKLMELENIFTQKELLIKEVGMKISKKDKVVKNGLTVRFMKVPTYVGKNMEMESSNGQMVEFTKVIIAMTKNMVKVYILGPMEECTKVGFRTENNMEKEFTNNKMVHKFTEYGLKVKKVLFAK